MRIYVNIEENNLKDFLIYVNLCKYHRQTNKHIKSIVRNLTKYDIFTFVSFQSEHPLVFNK